MPVQRKSPRLLDRVTDLLAAAQQDLPKADVQITQIGLNPIRTFAALLFYVSHADKAADYLLATGSGPPLLSQFASAGESNSDNRAS